MRGDTIEVYNFATDQLAALLDELPDGPATTAEITRTYVEDFAEPGSNAGADRCGMPGGYARSMSRTAPVEAEVAKRA